MTAIGLRGPQTLADIPISAENSGTNSQMDSYLGTPGKAMT